jgi:hypothetical protein
MTTHRALATAALIIMALLGGGPATGQPRSNAAELEKTAAFERILFGGIRFNNLERVSEALRGGADPNHAKDPLSDMPPLFFAVSDASGKPEIVKLLIEHGADVNARWTPGGTKRKSDADNNPLLLLLLQKAAAEQNRDYFPLYWAAMNNNSAGVKVLIEAGADVHAKTGNLGMTALFATYEPAVGDSLLSSGAELNAKDARGDTVLIHARKRLAFVERSDARELLRTKLETYVNWLKLKGAKE